MVIPTKPPSEAWIPGPALGAIIPRRVVGAERSPRNQAPAGGGQTWSGGRRRVLAFGDAQSDKSCSRRQPRAAGSHLDVATLVSRLLFWGRDSQWQVMEHPQPAAVLLSGGLDSATTLAIARSEGYQCHCLTVDYGQRHRIELEAARRVADALGAASHRVVALDLRAIGGSALTDDIEVPKGRNLSDREVPATYVPARNTVFLALLLGLAEVNDAEDLFIGANAVDYSGYPDCRPEFLRAFETLADVATVAGAEHGVRYRIHAPLLRLNKAEIIRRGIELGVDYSLTHSCYDPTAEGLACGRCDSCVLRRRGFADAGVPDPTRYVPEG